MKKRPVRIASLCALAALASPLVSLQAATFVWDPSGTGTQAGGAGNWDSSSAFWYGTSLPDVAWPGAGNSALFKDSAAIANYTVTVQAGGISAGGLEFQNTASTGVTLDGGVITLSNGGSGVLIKNSTAGSSSFVAINSVLAGTENVTFTVNSNLQVNTAVTYTGSTTITTGNLRLGAVNALAASSSLAMNGGSILTSSNQTFKSLSGSSTNSVIRNNGDVANTLTINGSATATFAGTIADGGGAKTTALTIGGTSVQTLTNANSTYTGATTVSGGTLIAGGNSQATSMAANSAVTVNSTTDLITWTGNTLANGDKVVLSASGTVGGLNVSNPAATNNQYFVVNKSGDTFQLSATSGGAAIDITSNGASVTASQFAAGVFGMGNSAIILGDAATTTNNSSASLLTGGAFTIGRAVTIANQSTTGIYTIGGNTTSTSAFSGLVTANQNLTISQVAGGTLNISGGIVGASSGTKTVRFNNAGAVNINTAGIGNGSTGAIAVTKAGAGVTTLGAVNSYTGDTTLTAGTLALGVNNAFGATNFVFNGGTLAVGAFTNSSVGTLSLTANSTLTLGSGGSFAFANSSALDWGSFTLSISGSFVDGSSIRFGTDASALTGAQLSRISINGGAAFIDSSGFLSTVSAVPEPSTYALLAGGAFLGLAVLRRRNRR